MGGNAGVATTRGGSRGGLFIFACFCAVALVIHVRATVPAAETLERRRAQAETLRLSVEAEKHRGEVLRQRVDALAHDPQTVERELRQRGMGRAGETRLVPAKPR